MLTDKREKYIQGLLDGLSQRKAYRQAFPSSLKWKDSTVDRRASELKKNSEVLARYQELKKEQEEEYKAKRLWDLEKATKSLMRIMSQAQNDIKIKGVRQANSNAFISALKELNDLEGLGKGRAGVVSLNEARLDKLRAEIDKIKSDNTEKKQTLSDFFALLDKEIEDE